MKRKEKVPVYVYKVTLIEHEFGQRVEGIEFFKTLKAAEKYAAKMRGGCADCYWTADVEKIQTGWKS